MRDGQAVDHAGGASFFVTRAASIEAPIFDLALERIPCPFIRVADPDGIDVAIIEQGAWPSTYSAYRVTHAVEANFLEAECFHLGLDSLDALLEGAGSTHFSQPTDVEFGPDGSVYVSDGYINRRVVSFTADGEYRFEWGAQGPEPEDFYVAHDLAVDGRGRVYVADRENDRIQIFKSDGTYVNEWRSEGAWRPYGIDIDPSSGYVYVIDGGAQPYVLPHRSDVVVLDGTGAELQRFGRFGNHDGQFIMGHDIALDRDGNVLVADVLGRRLQRFNRIR